MPTPIRIGFILVPGYSLMSMAAAVEPLRAANLLAGRVLYDVRHLSTSGGFVASTSGGGFQTEPVSQARQLDLALIVAGGNPIQHRDTELMRALRTLAQKWRIPLGGISGGAAILARAGLMEGRRFTLHWAHIDALSELMPNLLIERALFVIDRDRHSCAGGIAALDMMCANIARDHGPTFAREVADWFIHTRPRLADEPQLSPTAARFGLRHPTLVRAVDLMFANLADPLSPSDIARAVGSSQRQLGRLFNAELGQPLSAFYRHMRLKKADELILQSGLSMLDISLLTGFGSAAHFSRAYAAKFGISPTARRRG
ncbi:MAG: GlxA family transcriptional regulator [Paracoccus denitrificans]|uniref:GlxA family transcriptional regulator n=1 Tax=Paracoccus denitrificans TaxID=266 RepID=A0A533HZD3_PARDE|nr:MAG: GlxA family transcriptional regulator [Paracoccus denitrificans]